MDWKEGKQGTSLPHKGKTLAKVFLFSFIWRLRRFYVPSIAQTSQWAGRRLYSAEAEVPLPWWWLEIQPRHWLRENLCERSPQLWGCLSSGLWGPLPRFSLRRKEKAERAKKCYCCSDLEFCLSLDRETQQITNQKRHRPPQKGAESGMKYNSTLPEHKNF